MVNVKFTAIRIRDSLNSLTKVLAYWKLSP